MKSRRWLGQLRRSLVASIAGALACAALAAPPPTLSVSQLESQIAQRISRVEEFRFIRETCQALGVRCWLFGGTAAGYGHYVKWDLLREGGDTRFQKDRFDYDYTNIFRSTQDADIVIDGPPENASKLEAALRERFPHLQGSKSAWEVRLLRAARDDKEAILANPDFLNQHTDSNSTGMIELTRPPEGESVVRDVRDWTPAPGQRPQFFQDIHEGKLHYYHSPTHATTARFKAGKNPEIFSAVRALTKAFQYELELRPEDWKKLKEVIERFDAGRDLADPYARHWIEKNGSKVFQHAVNLEYAWNKAEELGLRRKLLALGNPDKTESLAWWMDKEPLRRKPVGEGTGRTAAEIFAERGLSDLTVAHETRSFLAYESITRAHTGEPNVLVSRAGKVGEEASFGQGFYTQIGEEGARGTNLTIRFKVDPRAREGTDFLYDKSFLIITNKDAIRVIPESLNFTLLQYFEFLASGSEIRATDKALLEKLQKRIGSKWNAAGIEERQRIRQLALAEPHRPVVFQAYLKILPRPVPSEDMEYIRQFVGKQRPQPDLIKEYFAILPPSVSQVDQHLLTRLIGGALPGAEGRALGALFEPIAKLEAPERKRFLTSLLSRTRGSLEYNAIPQLFTADILGDPELIRLSRRHWTPSTMVSKFFSEPASAAYEGELLALLKEEPQNHLVVEVLGREVFTEPHSHRAFPNALDWAIRNLEGDPHYLLVEAFEKNPPPNLEELLLKMINTGRDTAIKSVLLYTMNHPGLEKIFEAGLRKAGPWTTEYLRAHFVRLKGELKVDPEVVVGAAWIENLEERSRFLDQFPIQLSDATRARPPMVIEAIKRRLENHERLAPGQYDEVRKRLFESLGLKGTEGIYAQYSALGRLRARGGLFRGHLSETLKAASASMNSKEAMEIMLSPEFTGPELPEFVKRLAMSADEMSPRTAVALGTAKLSAEDFQPVLEELWKQASKENYGLTELILSRANRYPQHISNIDAQALRDYIENGSQGLVDYSKGKLSEGALNPAIRRTLEELAPESGPVREFLANVSGIDKEAGRCATSRVGRLLTR